MKESLGSSGKERGKIGFGLAPGAGQALLDREALKPQAAQMLSVTLISVASGLHFGQFGLADIDFVDFVAVSPNPVVIRAMQSSIRAAAARFAAPNILGANLAL